MSLPWVLTVPYILRPTFKALGFLRIMHCVVDVAAAFLVSMFPIVLRVESHR